MKSCEETPEIHKYAKSNVKYFSNEKKQHFLKTRDTLTEQITPHQIEFGHLTENPSGWEERYERKNLKSQRHQGRVCQENRHFNFIKLCTCNSTRIT